MNAHLIGVQLETHSAGRSPTENRRDYRSGGFAGLEAAHALADVEVDVVLFHKKNHHCQPLLYQVATAALSAADVAWPVRSILGPPKRHMLISCRLVIADGSGSAIVEDALPTIDYSW